MSHVATDFHEVRGFLNWNQHGDSPYWAVRKLSTALDGGHSFDAEIDGQTVRISFNNKRSGISPRPQDSVEEVREYGIWWELENGLRFGGFLKPRFEAKEFRQKDPDVPFWDRDQITVPKNLGEAVSFQIMAGTYRPPSFYREMLPKVLVELAREAEIGWNPDYLSGVPHETSTIFELEVTLRYHSEEAKKVVRSDGIMHRLALLLSDDRGTMGSLEWDNDGVVGYNHRLRLNERAASELFPGQRHGFQFKSYHPKYVRKQASDDPLSHPRVGVLFKKTLNSGNGFAWDEWRELAREGEETLINVLRWGNVPTEPGPAFIPDDYFDVRESDRQIGFYDDPTPAIEHEQENVVMRVLARANDSAWDLSEQLVADGGSEHYSRLDLTTSTAYRALDELEGIAESQNGVFRFISEKIRQDVKAVVERQRAAREDLERNVLAIAHLLDVDPQRIQEKGGAFQEWLTTYSADVEELDDHTRLKIGAMVDRLRSTSVPQLSDVLLEGLRAWRDAGLDPNEFHRAEVVYRDSDGNTRSARAGAALR